jgi:hypothetical protein
MLNSRTVSSLNDLQASRVIIAAYVLEVRPDGYFPQQAKKKLNELSKTVKSQVKLTKAVRKYMADLTRKIASEIDEAADAYINKKVNEACAAKNLPLPKVDADWLSFIVSGTPTNMPSSTSEATDVAIAEINNLANAINSKISKLPKGKMKPINIKLTNLH